MDHQQVTTSPMVKGGTTPGWSNPLLMGGSSINTTNRRGRWGRGRHRWVGVSGSGRGWVRWSRDVRVIEDFFCLQFLN